MHGGTQTLIMATAQAMHVHVHQSTIIIIIYMVIYIICSTFGIAIKLMLFVQLPYMEELNYSAVTCSYVNWQIQPKCVLVSNQNDLQPAIY